MHIYIVYKPSHLHHWFQSFDKVDETYDRFFPPAPRGQDVDCPAPSEVNRATITTPPGVQLPKPTLVRHGSPCDVLVQHGWREETHDLHMFVQMASLKINFRRFWKHQNWGIWNRNVCTSYSFFKKFNTSSYIFGYIENEGGVQGSRNNWVHPAEHLF